MIFMMVTSMGVKYSSHNKVEYLAAPVNRKLRRKAIVSAFIAALITCGIIYLLGTETVSLYIRKEP